mmetsp:Transcript_31826/g.79692  ORF Transcript_31826/g.79692 Transcript_31826/m.79692 type:complete len:217 (+) Transcript_31826:241-891(+)
MLPGQPPGRGGGGRACVYRPEYLRHAMSTFSMNCAASSCPPSRARLMLVMSSAIRGSSIAFSPTMSSIVAFLSLAVRIIFMRSTGAASAAVLASRNIAKSLVALCSTRYFSLVFSSSAASTCCSRYSKNSGVICGLQRVHSYSISLISVSKKYCARAAGSSRGTTRAARIASSLARSSSHAALASSFSRSSSAASRWRCRRAIRSSSTRPSRLSGS